MTLDSGAEFAGRREPGADTFESFVKLLLSLVARRRRLLLVVFLLAASGAVLGAYVKRPSFESSASVLVTLDTPSVSSSGSEVRRVVAQLEADDVIASQVELIKTRQLAEELVDSLPESVFVKPPSSRWYIRLVSTAIGGVTNAITGVLQDLLLIERTPERYRRIKYIENGLKAFAVRKAQMLIVTFRARDPEDPEIVLNKLLELYGRKVLDLRNSAEGYELFTTQAMRLNDELSAAERTLSRFKIDHNVLDLEAERQRLLSRLVSYSAVIDAQASGGGSADPETGDAERRYLIVGPEAPPQVSQMVESLNAMLIERARLLSSFAPEHPDVLRLGRQIAEIDSSLQRDVDRLAGERAQGERRLRQLLEIAPQYNELSRAVKILTDAYEVHRKAAEDRETTRERDLKIVVQVVDPPRTTYLPLPPNRLTLVLAGLVFALILALAAVIVTEWLSKTFRKPGRRPAEASDA